MGSSPTLHTHSPSCSLHVLTCTGFIPARGTFPRLSGVGEGILLAACWGPCPHVVWGEGHSLPSPLRDSAQPHPSLSEAADEQGWGSPLLGMMLQARPLVCSWKPEAGFSPGKSLVPRGGGGVGGSVSDLEPTGTGRQLTGYKLSAQGHTASSVRPQDPLVSCPSRVQNRRAKGPLTTFNACTHFTDEMTGAQRRAGARPGSPSGGGRAGTWAPGTVAH